MDGIEDIVPFFSPFCKMEFIELEIIWLGVNIVPCLLIFHIGLLIVLTISNQLLQRYKAKAFLL